MNAHEFVAAWKREKAEMLHVFLGTDATSAVAEQVREMGLTPVQLRQLRAVLDGAMTAVMYPLLLALQGEASIDGVQQTYELKAEDGTVLSGQIDAEAWSQFHGAI